MAHLQSINQWYTSVGDLDDLQMFYYFIESEGDPVRVSLLLWRTGGPGFSGLVYEIGALTFDYASFNGSLPTFIDNPHSWTKVAITIFLDAPVRDWILLLTIEEDYYSSDTKSAEAVYPFLLWLLDHPRFIKVPLYVAGDSYSGTIVPQVASAHPRRYHGKTQTRPWNFRRAEQVGQGEISSITSCYRALIYSGYHDMLKPYVGTQSWLFSLNMTVVDAWRPFWVYKPLSPQLILGMAYPMLRSNMGAGHTP